MLHQYKPLAITTHLNARSGRTHTHTHRQTHKSNVIRSHHFVTMAIAVAVAVVYKNVLSL